MKKCYAIVLLGGLIVDVLGLKEACELVKNGSYQELLSERREGDVAVFCKKLLPIMQKENSSIREPDWLSVIDTPDNIPLECVTVASERGNVLLRQWKPDTAKIWFDFAKALGNELSEEEIGYVSDMQGVMLQLQNKPENHDYDELLDGLDDITD